VKDNTVLQETLGSHNLFVDPVQDEIREVFVSRADGVLAFERVYWSTDGEVFRLSRLGRWLEMKGLDLRPATDYRGEPSPLQCAGEEAVPLELCVETMSTKSSD
jgi:hypothetical protein